MTRRIWNAYTVELARAMRHKPTYTGPLLVLAAVFACVPMHPVVRDGVSDYAFVAYATRVALHLVGLALVLVYCGALIAGDTASGTIRTTLTRPLLRHEYVLAKLLHAMTYTAGLTLLVGLASWTVAAAAGDLHGVMYGGELVHPASRMLRVYVLGALLSLVPQWAAAACALFISACIRRPLPAALLALGGWLAVDLLKYPLGIAPAVFTTHLETPWNVFAAYGDALPAHWGGVVRDVLLASLPALGVFTAGTVLVVQRRDLT